MNPDDLPSWYCCQIGAREHYSVPRALHQSGTSMHLLTDVWSAHPPSRLLPSRWQERCHPDLPRNLVTSWNFQAVGRTALTRLKRPDWWTQIQQTNRWFQKQVCCELKRRLPYHSEPPTVFAYSYAAKQIFEVAKSYGCRTILGQIDPGPEEVRLVREIEARHQCYDTPWPPEHYWNEWKQECGLADAIVVNSEWSKQALLTELIPSAQIHVIPLAYEQSQHDQPVTRTFPETFNQARPLRILYLGQAIVRKGILELAGAIEQLKDQPVEWTIVGPVSATCQSQLEALPQTHVTGAIPRHSVQYHYRQSDIFILPTHSDGFAITQLEAMEYGLPVIASERCGDVVQHGRNGLRLNSVTSGCIAENVQRLLENPALLNDLANGVNQTVRYTLKSLSADLLKLESSLMASDAALDADADQCQCQ